ncbi:MAG: regulatory protein RecX [Victivallaceae bacterium]|nr:regulatory protein RecX [Victivallaceae bacterium]
MGNNEVLKKAFDLLSRRAHSTQELRNKLYKRKFSKRDIETVIAECERLNFLDDELFADNYAAELSGQGKGRFKIKMKLRDKGLSEAHIEQALKKPGDCEQENAEQALKGKLRTLIHEDDINKRRQKAYRFLAYRGFSSDIITKLMDNTEELQYTR